jgi:hypothetical protein
MGRTCTVCNHPRRRDIDKAILTGEPERALAGRYRVARSSLQRHRPHVSEVMARAAEAREITHGENLVERLQSLSAIAFKILADARAAKQYSAAMSGVREMARIVELVAKLTGQLDESTRVNVLIAERDQREARQATDLHRLTLEERLELQRLLAKAQGADESTVEASQTTTIPLQDENSSMNSST